MSSIMLFPVRGHEKDQQTGTQLNRARTMIRNTNTTAKTRVAYGNSSEMRVNTRYINSTRGCTSGGVSVPCIYRVFLVVLELLQGSRWDQEQKGGAGPSPQKRSRAGRWSWAANVGLLSFQVVPQQRCNGHYLCDSAQARQLKQQLRSVQVAGKWRRDTAFIVLAAVHGLSGLFRAVSAVEPSLFRPLSPSLISILASVDVKQLEMVYVLELRISGAKKLPFVKLILHERSGPRSVSDLVMRRVLTVYNIC